MATKKQWCILALLSMAILMTTPFIGNKLLSFNDIATAGTDGVILRNLRIPRVLLAYLAGGILAYGGTCFQALFRNNLASPYTLGLSGGASLGVSLAAWLGCTGAVWGIGITSVAAFLGAALVSCLVYAISRFCKQQDSNTLLLSGVAVSFFTSSAIMFAQYAGREGELFRVMRWMAGSLSLANVNAIVLLAILWGLAIISFRFGAAEALDLLSLGDEFASSRGLNVIRARFVFFAGISLLTGAVVAICGPIGFIGLICPHICRCLFGAQHQRLLPFSMMCGGIFLVLCDCVGRSILPNADIPAGLITSLLGAPFFIYLLNRSR